MRVKRSNAIRAERVDFRSSSHEAALVISDLLQILILSDE
jgi:hypothetical protein